MAYSPSIPLTRWLKGRRDAINMLAAAHAAMAEIDGPGRPLEVGRPVGHAYVLGVVAEFQAFVRDLHDLAADGSARLPDPVGGSARLLIAAATEGDFIDRGNADIAASSRTSGDSASEASPRGSAPEALGGIISWLPSGPSLGEPMAEQLSMGATVRVP